MTAPRYVEYGGLTSAPGPLLCEDTTLFAFLAPASRERLEELCRRVIEEPSGGAISCRPLLGAVAITFGVIGRITVLTEPFNRMGHVREKHAAVWVPVLCSGPEGMPSIAVLIPYMWLDNPLSVASGREVYGYPKNWGWPSPSEFTEDAPPRFELDAYGIERYGRDEEPGRRRLLAMRRILASEGTRAPSVEVAPGQREQLRGMLGHEVPQLFLRQFRAPEGEGAADPSQVVVAPARVVPGSQDVEVLPPYWLSLRALDSHPLERELGLVDGALCPAFRISMAFRVENGRVVHPT